MTLWYSSPNKLIHMVCTSVNNCRRRRRKKRGEVGQEEETEGKERKARIQPLMDVNINISNGISQYPTCEQLVGRDGESIPLLV